MEKDWLTSKLMYITTYWGCFRSQKDKTFNIIIHMWISGMKMLSLSLS